MPNSTSERLIRSIPKILDLWEERVLVEVSSAFQEEKLTLRDSLPDYLSHLASALSNTIDRTVARKKRDKDESTRLGNIHGKERASNLNYTIDKLIFEYHVLRQVICDVLEEENILSSLEREIIVCSIEQAVNDAATQFNNTLKEVAIIAAQEEELKVSIRTRDDFLSIVSHELKTPLSSLLLQAQMLLKGKTSPDTAKQMKKNYDYASQVVVQVGRLNHLVDDMLDFGLILNGSYNFKFERLNISDVIIGVITKLNPVFQTFKIPPPQISRNDEAIAYLDKVRIEQVIRNILMNAIKYGRGKPITIDTWVHDSLLEVVITDQGIGIESANLERIFNRFERAISPNEVTGLGIGLFIVSEILKTHGGKIWVKSDYGKGSAFHFTIPQNMD